MSRKLPARLWLEPARYDKSGALTHASTWIIRDGSKKHRTGCSAADVPGAQRAFADYLAAQHSAAAPIVNKTADDTLIADVLAYYVQDAGDDVKRPKEMVARMESLLAWWGTKSLGSINRATCKAYVRERGSKSAARRDLEDLRSAVNLYIADGLCRQAVKVTLPEKHKARVEYFTRQQMIQILRHCWRARETQTIHRGPRKGEIVTTGKHHLRHLVPFILTALYTGTRSSRIWNASFVREEGRPWIDLDTGVFHRLAKGEVEMVNKRAGKIHIPSRLLGHMRRWRKGAMVAGGKRRAPQTYLCEYRGRPADPKKALAKMMRDVFGEDHTFVRHTFRHTCATWLMWDPKMHVNDVAAFMSMTPKMVEEVYAKEHPDAHKKVSESFSSGSAGRLVGRSRRERGMEPRQVATGA